MTLVSVVVPVHDGERFVADALGSIAAQRGVDVELRDRVREQPPLD